MEYGKIKEVEVKTDVLVQHFLELLYRDEVITTETYFKAKNMMREEKKSVDSNEIFKG